MGDLNKFQIGRNKEKYCEFDCERKVKTCKADPCDWRKAHNRKKFHEKLRETLREPFDKEVLTGEPDPARKFYDPSANVQAALDYTRNKYGGFTPWQKAWLAANGFDYTVAEKPTNIGMEVPRRNGKTDIVETARKYRTEWMKPSMRQDDPDVCMCELGKPPCAHCREVVYDYTETCVEEAIRIVNGQRREDYGSAEDSTQAIADVWSAYLGIEVSKRDFCLMMVLLKVFRDKGGQPKRDNIVDAHGYLLLLEKAYGNGTPTTSEAG